MIRRLFRAVLLGAASVFPQGSDRERHWSERAVQVAPLPADHADSAQ